MASQHPVASKPSATSSNAESASAPGGQWAHDSRVFFDPESNTYLYTGAVQRLAAHVQHNPFAFAFSQPNLSTKIYHSYNIDTDGITFEYDQIKTAWFPRFDEDLIRAQQSVYDMPSTSDTVSTSTHRRQHDPDGDDTDQPDIHHHADQHATESKPTTHRDKRHKPTISNSDTKQRHNTAVYITGLPPTTTVDDLYGLFNKYGIILQDPTTNAPRIKIYHDAEGRVKGDALIIYYKEESVGLAIDMLDGTSLHPDDGTVMRVQKAVFQEKKDGESQINTSAPKKQKHSIKKKLENRLGWFEDDETKTNPRVRKSVILKHMFTLQELEDDPALLLDLKQDVREECEKLGEVTNVVLYDLEEDGVMLVRFKEIISADACVQKMDGRFFGGKQIEASIWNGKTKYKHSSIKSIAGNTHEDEQKRLEAFEEWLESQH